MVVEMTPEIAIDINASPYCLSREVSKAEQVGDDRIAVDVNLLQAKSQFGGIGASTTIPTVHRKVGTVQIGMSRMY
uniref:Uncharacterized protein n=1 Tax=Nelumbo nucifera TaxID=4432 RepID=A0A822ZEU5_NELNU|nr:TPA_asm: hypothetical protein HUJ06_001637 [Nelumbo nucifera]